MMKQRLILIMAFFACAMTMMADGWTTITNGQLWYDTDGNVVQAHAPGFLKEHVVHGGRGSCQLMEP